MHSVKRSKHEELRSFRPSLSGNQKILAAATAMSPPPPFHPSPARLSPSLPVSSARVEKNSQHWKRRFLPISSCAMASTLASALMTSSSSPSPPLLPNSSRSLSLTSSSRRHEGPTAAHHSPKRLGLGLGLSHPQHPLLQQQQRSLLCHRNYLRLRCCCSDSGRSSAAPDEKDEGSSSAAAGASPFDTNASSDSLGDEQVSRGSPWRTGLAALLAAATIGTGMHNADAELNKFEAETRGEFGVGSAVQYGSADLRGTVHANENFRRANFTSADMREADFSGCPFNGAYMEKAVAYKTNFAGADLSDTLMDRMVLNEANFTDALLVRAVLTRSDLGKAVVDGADFSDAVIDLTQKQALCRYASGINPVTGMDTRKSLGCGSTKRSAYGTPSSPELSTPPEKLLSRDGYCDSSTGLCKGTGMQ